MLSTVSAPDLWLPRFFVARTAAVACSGVNWDCKKQRAGFTGPAASMLVDPRGGGRGASAGLLVNRRSCALLGQVAGKAA